MNVRISEAGGANCVFFFSFHQSLIEDVLSLRWLLLVVLIATLGV